ncbi:hypothetical protein D9M70_613490 [compost metagenome]
MYSVAGERCSAISRSAFSSSVLSLGRVFRVCHWLSNQGANMAASWGDSLAWIRLMGLPGVMPRPSVVRAKEPITT